MLKVLYETDRFPAWAAFVLASGDYSSCTEEDVRLIDAWEEEMLSKGTSISYEYLEETDFHMFPEFGLGCNCIHVKVWGYPNKE